MTWQNAMQAIQTAVATAVGLPVSAVEWSHTGRDGLWTEYPRVKLVPIGNATSGIPHEAHTWDAVNEVMRRAVWSLDLFRVQVRIECDSTMLGDGAHFAPADRLGKVIRTPAVAAVLHAAGVALHTLREFGPFAVTAENRELSVSIAEALFQVNIPVDTTPQNGADWFNRVQIHNRVTTPERSYVVEVPPETPEDEFAMGEFSRTYPMTGAGSFVGGPGWSSPEPFTPGQQTSGMMGDGVTFPRFAILRRDYLTACDRAGPGIRMVLNPTAPMNDSWPWLDGGAGILIPLPWHDRITVDMVVQTNAPAIIMGGAYYMGTRAGLIEYRAEGVRPDPVCFSSVARFNGAFGGAVLEDSNIDGGFITSFDVSAFVSGGSVSRRFVFEVNGTEAKVSTGIPGGELTYRGAKTDPYRRPHSKPRGLVIGLGHGLNPVSSPLEVILRALTVSGARY